MESNLEIITLEGMFRHDIVIGIAVTLPMKMALDELSRTKRIPVSVMVRNIFIEHFINEVPEFKEIYTRHLREQAEVIKYNSLKSIRQEEQGDSPT